MYGTGREFVENFEEVCKNTAGGELVEQTPSDWSGGFQVGCKLSNDGESTTIYPRRGKNGDYGGSPNGSGDPGVHIQSANGLHQARVESFNTSDIPTQALVLSNNESSFQFLTGY